MPASTIPPSLPSDPIEVNEALEVARALWDKGDRRDAIRWIRRAFEAADEAGQVARGVALARAAAELETDSVPPPAHSQTRAASRPAPPPLPSSRPAKPSLLPAPPLRPSSVQAARSAPQPKEKEKEPSNEKRLRVSVRTSARDASLFVVRPLAEGQSAPPGTREAYLVMVEAEQAGSTRGRVA